MFGIDMARWSISRRIRLITQALMAALFLALVVGVVSTIRLSGFTTEHQRKTESLIDATTIVDLVRKGEIAALEYRTRPSDEAAEHVGAHLADASGYIDALIGQLHDAPDLADKITALEARTRVFEEHFATLVDAMVLSDGLSLEIEALGPQAISDLEEIDTFLAFSGVMNLPTNLKIAVREALLMRVYIERYALTGSPSDRDQAGTHYNIAQSELNYILNAVKAEPMIAEVVQTGLASVDEFFALLAASESIQNTRDGAVNSLVAAAGEIGTDIDVFLEALNARKAALAAQSKATRTATISTLVVFGILAQGASWWLAHRIAKGTTEAVGTSVKNMRDLAEGNLDLEIPGTDLDHELGDMARALHIFRDRALETKSLEAQQRAQAEDAKERDAEAEQQRKAQEVEAARRVEAARKKMLTDLKVSVGAVVEAGAKGDFTPRIETRFDEPELEEMAQSINRLVENVDAGVAEVVRVMDDLARGNLTSRMQGRYHGAFATLQHNVNGTFERLADMVVDLSGQCDDVTHASDGMSQQAVELARRAEQQAASLEQTSAAIEEISVSARSSAAGARDAAEVARGATDSVEKAGEVVTSAIGAMGDIRDASSRIDDIVGVIDGIAFQTNLLALNASVEAARAGSAGKGFAVVATEVRALAQRSSDASKDIKQLIEESALQVSRGVGLVEETGKTLETIMSGVSEMAATMQKLTQTAQEQATGVGDVSAAITQLDGITQKNAALSDQSRTAASNVGAQAQAMRKLVSWFHTEATSDAMRIGEAS